MALERLVSPTFGALTHDGVWYRIPNTLDLEEARNRPAILLRRKDLAATMGLQYHEDAKAPGVYSCTGCTQSSILSHVKKESEKHPPIGVKEVYEEGDIPGISTPEKITIGYPVFVEDPRSFCRYQADPRGPWWLSYVFNHFFPEDDYGFAVVKMRCIDYDTSYIAMIEAKVFEQYRIDDPRIDLKTFPRESEIVKEKNVIMSMVARYQQLPCSYPKGETAKKNDLPKIENN